MFSVFSAKFSPDTKYLLSGSDDGNIRLWRSQASDRSRILSAREREKREYDDALRERYKHMPEIKRIDRHRHVCFPPGFRYFEGVLICVGGVG